jgi:hypothetical protein
MDIASNTEAARTNLLLIPDKKERHYVTDLSSTDVRISSGPLTGSRFVKASKKKDSTFLFLWCSFAMRAMYGESMDSWSNHHVSFDILLLSLILYMVEALKGGEKNKRYQDKICKQGN